MENLRKHTDIKLVTTDRRRSHLMSEPDHNTTNWFLKKLLAIKMNKKGVKLNKPVYLGLYILYISILAIHDVWKTKVWKKYKTLLQGYRQINPEKHLVLIEKDYSQNQNKFHEL